MAKSKDINDPLSVTAYIEQLPTDFGLLVEAVRQCILSVSDQIGEQIKWNAPSFFFTGEMQAFDPKTYQRDMAVMHLRKGVVLLIFPTGESVKTVSSILEGNYTDGRRMVTIADMQDFKQKETELTKVIVAWLALLI